MDVRQPEKQCTLQTVSIPFGYCQPPTAGCPLKAQPQGHRQQHEPHLPLELVLCSCSVRNSKARWWCPFSSFKSTQIFPWGLLHRLLVPIWNWTTAVCCAFTWWLGFPLTFLSSPPPRWMLSLQERKYSASKRDDVTWRQQKWSCEALLGQKQLGVQILQKVSVTQEPHSPLHLQWETLGAVFGFWGKNELNILWSDWQDSMILCPPLSLMCPRMSFLFPRWVPTFVTST